MRSRRKVTLDFSVLDGKLYGREKELLRLKEAYMDNNTRVALIKGICGSGKSSLVQKFAEAYPQAFLVDTKYDLNIHTEPYVILGQALLTLCQHVAASRKLKALAASAIQQNLSTSDVQHLLKVVPHLALVIGEEGEKIGTTKAAAADVGAAHHRQDSSQQEAKTVVLLKRLLRILSANCSIILFFDDLQWADRYTIQLFDRFLIDENSNEDGTSTEKNLFCVGTYRPDQVTKGHELLPVIDKLGMETIIVLEHLEVTPIGEMLRDLLDRRCVSDTLPLAELVHKKTAGHAFFVYRFLEVLVEREMIYYDLQKFQWSWDLDGIQGDTQISNNVADIVADKLQSFGPKCLWVLQMACALGSHFSLETLDWIRKATSDDCVVKSKEELEESLDQLCSVMLIEKRTAQGYKFSHDRIQWGAYHIATVQDMERLHYQIGEIIWERYKQVDAGRGDKGNDWLLFVAAEQLNKGVANVGKNSHQVSVLNLNVAKRAIELSAFLPASIYALTAVVLNGSDWGKDYKFSLDLYSTAIIATYGAGDMENSCELAQTVIQYGRCIDDKVVAYKILIKIMCANNKNLASLDMGYKCLAELDIKMTSRPTNFQVVREFNKVRKSLGKHSPKDLLNLPMMTNPHMLDAQEILEILSKISFDAGFLLHVQMCTLRHVRLFLEGGLSAYAYSGLCGYAIMLSGTMGKVSEGLKYAELAENLRSTLSSSVGAERLPRTEVGLVQFLTHIKQPYHNLLESLRGSYESAMISGDVETAFLAAQQYSLLYVNCGLPLASIEQEMASFNQEMNEYGVRNAQDNLRVALQMVYNLSGNSDSTIILQGAAFREDQFTNTVKHRFKDTSGNNEQAVNLHVMRIMALHLGCFFDDLQRGEELLQQINKGSAMMMSHFMADIETFVVGMAACALYSKSGSRSHLKMAREKLKKLETSVKVDGAVNCAHKMHILGAELACSEKGIAVSRDSVKLQFDKALTAAARVGFVHDRALAAYRASQHMSKIGEKEEASYYLKCALEAYSEWGAHAVADAITAGGTPRASRRRFSAQRGSMSSSSRSMVVLHKELSFEHVKLVSTRQDSNTMSLSNMDFSSNRGSVSGLDASFENMEFET